MARPELARNSDDTRARRRYAMARSAEEGPRLDPVHRRTADGPCVFRLRCRGSARSAQAQDDAKLSGHLHWREKICAADFRHDAKPADEKTCGAVHGQLRLPPVQRQTAAARSAVG